MDTIEIFANDAYGKAPRKGMLEHFEACILNGVDDQTSRSLPSVRVSGADWWYDLPDEMLRSRYIALIASERARRAGGGARPAIQNTTQATPSTDDDASFLAAARVGYAAYDALVVEQTESPSLSWEQTSPWSRRVALVMAEAIVRWERERILDRINRPLQYSANEQHPAETALVRLAVEIHDSLERTAK